MCHKTSSLSSGEHLGARQLQNANPGHRARLLEIEYHGASGAQCQPIPIPLHGGVQPTLRSHPGCHVDERLFWRQGQSKWPSDAREPHRTCQWCQHHLLAICQSVLCRLHERAQGSVRRNPDACALHRQSHYVLRAREASRVGRCSRLAGESLRPHRQVSSLL
jgi:hypothetical protein